MEEALEEFLADDSFRSQLLDSNTHLLLEEVLKLRAKYNKASDDFDQMEEIVKARSTSFHHLRHDLDHLQVQNNH